MSRTVYRHIQETAPADLERRIMEILEAARKSSPGTNITRPELVLQIFGIHTTAFSRQPSASTKDRQIRDAIADLQEQGYPIIASSGAAGYRLAINDQERLEYIREIEARIKKLENKLHALRSPRWHYGDEPGTPTQAALF
jgi:flagellar motility protein MotE (MotC chaperone)